MRERNGCGKYITKTLVRQVYFPEGQEVCRMCPFCIADPSNHKTYYREYANLGRAFKEKCNLRDAKYYKYHGRRR